MREGQEAVVKALTLWQPWASLIGYGAKTIETRSWSTEYRGPLAIHAAKRPTRDDEMRACRIGMTSSLNCGSDEGWKDLLYPLDRRDLSMPYPLPLGAVVATCRLVDVVPMVMTAPYAQSPSGPDSTDDPGIPHLLLAGRHGHLWVWDGVAAYDVEFERPYGDFHLGRFAWLLGCVKAIAPVPAKGHQGLWEWEELS